MNFQDYCNDVTAKLSQIKIVPVLVLNDLESGLKMCELLAECGLPAAEITFRTSAAESIIREAAERFPELYLGAGTILNTADLARAFDAGATFAVAPGFNPIVVEEENDETEGDVNYITELEKALRRKFGRKVKIFHGKKAKRLEIEFSDDRDLQALLTQIGGDDLL